MLARLTNDGDARAIALAEPLIEPLTFLRPRLGAGRKESSRLIFIKGISYVLHK